MSRRVSLSLSLSPLFRFPCSSVRSKMHYIGLPIHEPRKNHPSMQNQQPNRFSTKKNLLNRHESAKALFFGVQFLPSNLVKGRYHFWTSVDTDLGRFWVHSRKTNSRGPSKNDRKFRPLKTICRDLSRVSFPVRFHGTVDLGNLKSSKSINYGTLGGVHPRFSGICYTPEKLKDGT